VSMEFTMLLGSTTFKTTNWEFDKSLDPSLFEQIPPQGYTLQQPLELGKASIKDVAATLRIWAQARGGTFPDDLSPARCSTEIKSGPGAGSLAGPNDKQNVTKEQADQDMQKTLGRGFLFLAQHPQAVYAGKGVKMGDAQTPIYWFKAPGKDAKTYKVIYADLSIREVAEEPARPAAGAVPEK
jgi:hypothetical protein